MAHPRLRLRKFHCSLLLTYLPRKDGRLSRPGWLTYSGRFTHISDHQSVADRAQDREGHWSKTDVLPLWHATKQSINHNSVTGHSVCEFIHNLYIAEIYRPGYVLAADSKAYMQFYISLRLYLYAYFLSVTRYNDILVKNMRIFGCFYPHSRLKPSEWCSPACDVCMVTKCDLRNENPWVTGLWKLRDPTVISFDSIPVWDEQTDGQTNGHAAYIGPYS